MTERIRISPTEFTTRDANGNITFAVDRKYVKQDPTTGLYSNYMYGIPVGTYGTSEIELAVNDYPTIMGFPIQYINIVAKSGDQTLVSFEAPRCSHLIAYQILPRRVKYTGTAFGYYSYPPQVMTFPVTYKGIPQDPLVLDVTLADDKGWDLSFGTFQNPTFLTDLDGGTVTIDFSEIDNISSNPYYYFDFSIHMLIHARKIDAETLGLTL